MLIGSILFITLLGIGITWVEKTKTGKNFADWCSKVFFNENLADLED